MKCRSLPPICLGIVLVALTGCGRVIDWSIESFGQGTNLPEITGPQKYIRSIVLHDQFSTVARFDALWLAPEVRTGYAELRNRRSAKTEDNQKAFLRRQLEENVHFLSFYVLSGQDVVLGTDVSKWSVMLKLGDDAYSPVEIASVDLPVEYQYFFGKKFNAFKAVYLVRFDAKAIGGQRLIKPEMQELKLVFRSSHKEGVLSWQFDAAKPVSEGAL